MGDTWRMDDPALVVLCTAPANNDSAGADVAARLARGLVDANLAACVNLVSGVRSFYRWEGAVQDDAEVQLVIKTRRSRFAELEEWLKREHPYSVPEIIALPIERGSQAYLDWVRDQT
jgi:periplasmic divalent cation tolerance protein